MTSHELTMIHHACHWVVPQLLGLQVLPPCSPYLGGKQAQPAAAKTTAGAHGAPYAAKNRSPVAP